MKKKFEYDWDYICNTLHKQHGWGDGYPQTMIEEFEDSGYFTDTKDDDSTIKEFNTFLYDLSTGNLN